MTTEPDWYEKDPVQRATLDAFAGDGSSGWVWLVRSQGGEHEYDKLAQFAALLPSDVAATSLDAATWEVDCTEFGFGFETSFAEDEPEHTYMRFPDDGTEMLVYCRDFHGAKEGYYEVAEEVRLLFNLWEDPRTKNYWIIDSSGEAEEVIRREPSGIRASMKLVRRYQAAKQLHLALYLDARRWGLDDSSKFEEVWEYQDEEKAASYAQGETRLLEETRYSRLLAKRLLPPPPRERCGLPPFDEVDEPALSFTIGTDANGEDVEFTSDPDQLANYFGANPDNPHYLTPVFFKRDVLSRYYGDPDRFEVRFGYLDCYSLWGVEIDNDLPDHVMVFLGDLGQRLPRSEAKHWRNFNVAPPESGPSESAIRRSFANQWAEPASADHRFRRAYRGASKAWEEAFGYPLFNALHGDDRHVLATLRIPITDGAQEFDAQVLSVAKLLADGLNDSGLDTSLSERVKDEKSIAKLTRMLEGLGREDASELTKPIAAMQGLRSRGAAHLKGTSYDLTKAIGDRTRREGFEVLLSDLTASLEQLKVVAEAQVSEDPES